MAIIHTLSIDTCTDLHIALPVLHSLFSVVDPRSDYLIFIYTTTIPGRRITLCIDMLRRTFDLDVCTGHAPISGDTNFMLSRLTRGLKWLGFYPTPESATAKSTVSKAEGYYPQPDQLRGILAQYANRRSYTRPRWEVVIEAIYKSVPILKRKFSLWDRDGTVFYWTTNLNGYRRSGIDLAVNINVSKGTFKLHNLREDIESMKLSILFRDQSLAAGLWEAT